jgi:hypothetical protein
VTSGNERTWRVAGLALAIAAVVFAAAPSADSQTATARVYFLQGEQMVAVTRGGSTVRTAVAPQRALVASGTLSRPQRRWLLTDPSRLRVVG